MVLRYTFDKGELNEIFYTYYKIFDNEKFEEDLKNNYSPCQSINCFTLHLNSF